MRTVLIVGTSMAEASAEGVPAYPDLLEERLGGEWKLTRLIRSGKTTEDLRVDTLEALRARPNAVVLHVGINDCGPRPLTLRERRWLARLRPGRLRGWIIGFIHRHRARIIRLRGVKQLTPLPRFVSLVDEVATLAGAGGASVLVLPITRAPATAEIRQPFLNREADRYNSALREVARRARVRFVEREELLQGLTPEEAASAQDSVHLGGRVHRHIADLLTETLETLAREWDRASQKSG